MAEKKRFRIEEEDKRLTIMGPNCWYPDAVCAEVPDDDNDSDEARERAEVICAALEKHHAKDKTDEYGVLQRKEER